MHPLRHPPRIATQKPRCTEEPTMPDPHPEPPPPSDEAIDAAIAIYNDAATPWHDGEEVLREILSSAQNK